MSLILGVGVKYTRHIKELTPARVEKMLNAAMISGALLIANEWKVQAPYKTGTYRRSIHVAGHSELTSGFEGEEIAPPNDPLIVIVGTKILDPPYPIFLEYGTSRMDPKPSAGPAFDTAKGEALKEIAASFEKLLEQDAL